MLSQLLLYLPGIIIFLVGSGQVRGYLRQHRAGGSLEGTIVGCQHVVKKDKKDRDVFNYYNVTVEFTDPQTRHMQRQGVKSPSEYSLGQPVMVYRDGNSFAITEKVNEFVFNPWEMMIGGALLILLAFYQNQANQMGAMICLALVLTGTGIALLKNYFSLKKKNLEPIEAKIVSVYSRQISKGTKILKADKYTYYPVVRYHLDGKEQTRLCSVNSSQEKSFTVGESMTLYHDRKNGAVLERHAQAGILIGGLFLTATGIVCALSILSVLIRPV